MTSARPLRVLLLAVPALLLLAACGGDDGGDSLPVPVEENGNGGDNGAAGNGDAGNGGGGGDVDLSDAPNPGEARLEVDGQTFLATSLSDCTADEAGWAVAGSGGEGEDRVGIEAFGAQVGDRFTAQIRVDVGGTIAYVHSAQRDEPPTVEGSLIGIAGGFATVGDDDSLENVGEGVLVANCE